LGATYIILHVLVSQFERLVWHWLASKVPGAVVIYRDRCSWTDIHCNLVI